MRTLIGSLTILALTSAGFADMKIKRADLPAIVRAAADEVSQGATITGYSRTVENGRTYYEVEMKSGSMAKDITLNAQGKVISVEQEVTLEELPEAARAAIQKAAGKGTITKVETITKGSAIYYEALVQGGTNKEVVVDARGKLVAR